MLQSPLSIFDRSYFANKLRLAKPELCTHTEASMRQHCLDWTKHFILGAVLVLVLPWSSAWSEDVAQPADEKPTSGPTATDGVQPGHSVHGEAFDEGPRQAATLFDGNGAIHFPITTKDPAAQKYFDQGIGQLHGFWYFEAERSFRQVAALDPDCAMAYWGMAMANEKNEKRAKAFINKAVEKKGTVGPREARWIDALAGKYAGPDTVERRRQYIRDLESLVQDDPNDIEAKAFLVLQIWANGSWMTDKSKQLPISSHQAVDALIDQVLAKEPMHPIHHYRIHLWDEEKPIRAVTSASLCGQSAPAIAHMWHMPGHTYSKLHRYSDAAWQQEASARVDHAHMMRIGILPDQIHNYAHNNEWLVRNLAILGRVHEAEALAKNLIDLPRHPKYNLPTLGKSSSAFGRTRLLDVWEQYERWQRIIDHADTQYFALRKEDFEENLRRHRLLALAWFGLGNPVRAGEQVSALEKLLTEKRMQRYEAADAAEKKARDEKKSDQDTSKAMADAMLGISRDIKQVETTLAELRSHAAIAQGDRTTALAELAKAKEGGRLRDDYLARTYLAAGNLTEAESLARSAVTKGPNEVYPLATLVEVLHQAGKEPEARAEFARLRSLAANADLDMPVFQRLAPIAAAFGWPEDWRETEKPADDTGNRPALADLGPFRWAPRPAPSWEVAGTDGRTITLADYKGKPVVVIFYLGAGCLHCVEQLQKFAPMAKQYADAGIELLAISTEDLSLLQASLTDLAKDAPFPFPLAADPDLVAFQAYDAFDDFEQVPLHATYLIDANGMVRWRDISAEPFADATFLLEESQRLLQIREDIPHAASALAN